MSTIIGSLPISLQNGTLADATQVMSDFNFIVAQVNANAAQLAGGNAFTGAQSIAGDTIATLTALQTLTQKTLTAPIINTAGPNSAQQHTLPAVASDTFTLNAATQTLTNKTITAPSITTPTITTPTITGTGTAALSSVTLTGNNACGVTQLSTSAGFNGFQVNDQTGARRLELLLAGSANGGFYGITAGNAVLNFSGAGVTTFAISFSDALVYSFTSAGVFTATTLATTGDNNGRGLPVARSKAAATSRNTTTVVAADPDLQVPLGVGTWLIAGFIPVSCGAGGLKTALNFTGTQTNNVYSVIGSLNNVAFTLVALPFTNGVANSVGSATDWIELRGTVTVTVAGTLQFQWAQNSSNAANTSVLTGANMVCTKVT